MSNLPAKVYALHGFLGLPRDWEGFDVEPVEIKPSRSMKAWAEEFNQRISLEEDADHRKFLLGYSMGGRLAMHLMADRPDLWEGAVLVSTRRSSQGLDQARIAQDQKWAERFEKDPWYEVVAAWMDQPIFNHSRAPIRVESDFSREDLGLFLRNFSSGKQEEEIVLDKEKVLWVVGEKDSIYVKAQPDALVLPHAGHRVLFDNPNGLKKVLARFLEEKNVRQLSTLSIN